jgi:hypothetical protein
VKHFCNRRIDDKKTQHLVGGAPPRRSQLQVAAKKSAKAKAAQVLSGQSKAKAPL